MLEASLLRFGGRGAFLNVLYVRCFAYTVSECGTKHFVTVHSVHSNVAKIHSRLPVAMEFWLVCLGILAYSWQNTSRDSGVWTVTNCPFYILIDIHSSLFLSFLRWYRQNNDRSNYKQSSKHHLFFWFCLLSLFVCIFLLSFLSVLLWILNIWK